MIAGVGVIAAETPESAAEQLEAARRIRARAIFGRGRRRLTDEEVDAAAALARGRGRRRDAHLHRGRRPREVADYLAEFAGATGADELITVHYSDSVPNRLRSVELLAGATDPAGTLAEGEGIALHPRFRFQGEDVVGDPRQVDEVVEALAGHRHDPVVDIGTGVRGPDRRAVEQDPDACGRVRASPARGRPAAPRS